MTRKLLGIFLCALTQLTAGPSASQPAATPSETRAGMVQGGQGEGYRSYRALPNRTNTMLRDSLDSDDAIGAQVVGPAGMPLGMLTDLLLDHDGRIGHAIIDIVPSLGGGNKPVAVELARLRRVEDHLMLEMTEEQLAALPEYRQVEDRWVRRP